MASFSEIPRQYLPVAMAIPLHFMLRYASDWTLYRLVVSYFGLRGRLWSTLNNVYWVGLAPYAGVSLFALLLHRTFPAQAAANLEFTYNLVAVSFLLMLLGPAAGVVACLKSQSASRGLAVVGFTAVGAFYVHDGGYQVVHLTSPQQLRDYINQQNAERYLIDYEMHGMPENGLQLIEDLGINNQSVLVTSHAANISVQKKCVALGVNLVAKSMVSYVPIA